MKPFCLRGLLTTLMVINGAAAANADISASASTQFNIATFLPEGYTLDGTVSYHANLQEAIDASGDGAILRFPPGRYLLDDPKGLRIPSDRTVLLDGVTIVLSPMLAEDGQAFLLENANDVTFRGGTIQGNRDAWPESVNISGIRVREASGNLRFEDMTFLDLSSNGIGVFGTEDAPIRHVWVVDCIARNCCNIYYDYLAEKKGPAKGSVREDQGSVCFYFVDDFVVRGNYLDGSRSDGTHFMGCKNGQISDNQILSSQMGGFFLERCHNVVASGNLMADNGSRGCTIERNSTSCILSGNVVTRSGREGLWAPDISEILVTDNIFRENGQKDDAEKDSEIRINDMSKFEVVPGNIRIDGNIFTTLAHSNGVIQVNTGVGDGIVIQNNSFNGPVRHLLLEPDTNVVVSDNQGLAPAP